MNPVIQRHFEAVEARLLQSAAIASYQILSQEIASTDGKLRIKATLSDTGIAEFFEYVSESEGIIHLLKYSFHWQDAQKHLQRRWDNAPHYPDLPHAPHHVHEWDGTVKSNANPPDLFKVIEEIEGMVNRSG